MEKKSESQITKWERLMVYGQGGMKMGKRKRESIWKEDKLMSSISWKPDGQKCPITNLIEGNGIKVSYNSDGTEQSRLSFKDGKIVDQ